MNYKRLGILAVITLATVGIVWATCPPDDNKWFWGMVTELGGTGIPDVTVQATPCSAINPGDCSDGNEPGHDTQSGITDALGQYQIGSPTQNLHFGHHTVKLEVIVPIGWEACPGYNTTIYVDAICGENWYNFTLCRPPLACRFTGGGVDTFIDADGTAYPIWDKKTYEKGKMSNGNGVVERYQFGGQAGANTALPPQPKGEWTHHQQRGDFGRFTFHGGTSSAPVGTEIFEIRCSDPGGCKPSGDPPSPAKQLDFDGIGTFRNIGHGTNTPTWLIPANVKVEGKKGNFEGTFHWFEVNIDDLGEPGNENPKKNPGLNIPETCPADGFGEKGSELLADCDCPDFYRITIYNGVDAANVVWLDENNIDPNSLDRTNVIYEVYGYIDGGNLQIHHLTGFDTK